MDRSQLPMRMPLVVYLVLAVTWPASAWATGSLTISLQDDRSRAVEGTVTARPEGGGQAQSCTTRGGRCSISGLRAGRHQVSATLVRGGFVPAASVMVVDGRAASVRLTALPPPVAGTFRETQTQTQGGGSPPQTPVTPEQGGTRSGPGGTTPGGVRVYPGGTGMVQGQHLPVPRPGPVPGRPGPIVVQPGTPGTQPAGQTPVQMSGTTATQTNAPRNLGFGQRAAIVGTTQDQRGRRVEGTVTVTQSGRTVGSVTTTGGSFTAFDLSPGQYALSFTALTGQRATRNVTVVAGAAASVRLSITR